MTKMVQKGSVFWNELSDSAVNLRLLSTPNYVVSQPGLSHSPFRLEVFVLVIPVRGWIIYFPQRRLLFRQFHYKRILLTVVEVFISSPGQREGMLGICCDTTRFMTHESYQGRCLFISAGSKILFNYYAKRIDFIFEMISFSRIHLIFSLFTFTFWCLEFF